MTPEDKLNALFAAERPRTPDYAFQAEAVRRIAVRRAWATVGALAPWAIAATAGLWAVQPVIGPLVQDMARGVGPAAGVLATGLASAIGAAWLARGRGRLRI